MREALVAADAIACTDRAILGMVRTRDAARKAAARAAVAGLAAPPSNVAHPHEKRSRSLVPCSVPCCIVATTATMHVRRAKGGQEATHPLLGDELRALRELKRQSASPFVFASERGGPFTPSGFAKLLARAGAEAKIGFKVHPHMLRHA